MDSVLPKEGVPCVAEFTKSMATSLWLCILNNQPSAPTAETSYGKDVIKDYDILI